MTDKNIFVEEFEGFSETAEPFSLGPMVNFGDTSYPARSDPFTVADFEKLLTERHEPEKTYGLFDRDVTMCRMSSTWNGEKLLADIEQKNREQGMGNYQIPNTNITLINYSVCPTRCSKTSRSNSGKILVCAAAGVARISCLRLSFPTERRRTKYSFCVECKRWKPLSHFI